MNNEDTVECLICHNRYTQLSSHLARKHKMTTDEYREKFDNAPTIAKSVSSKIAASISKRNKENWKDPEYIEKHKKISSEVMTALNNNPDFQKYVHEKRQEFLKTHPEKKEELSHRLSERNRENWKDPEYRRFMTNVLINNWRDPETRKIMLRNLINNGNRYNSGYTEDGTPYMSTWELFFINFLEDNHINYQYEFESFDYDNGDGYKRSYHPDFYLTDLDLYVEIHPKEWCDESFMNKISAVPNLLLLTEDELFSDNLLELIDNKQPSS